jgi:hypothetical protein
MKRLIFRVVIVMASVPLLVFAAYKLNLTIKGTDESIKTLASDDNCCPGCLYFDVVVDSIPDQLATLTDGKKSDKDFGHGTISGAEIICESDSKKAHPPATQSPQECTRNYDKKIANGKFSYVLIDFPDKPHVIVHYSRSDNDEVSGELYMLNVATKPGKTMSCEEMASFIKRSVADKNDVVLTFDPKNRALIGLSATGGIEGSSSDPSMNR